MIKETIIVEEPKEIYNPNTNIPLSDFDWAAHEAECPSRVKQINKHIKTQDGEKVYSREPYAQELLKLFSNHWVETNSIFEVETRRSYEGKIFALDGQWASIDIGYKELVYVDIQKESKASREHISNTSEVSVQVTDNNTKGTRGFIIGSVDAGLKTSMLREIVGTIEEGTTAYVGRVLRMIPGGGYIVEINGIECFMPGSLAGINKLHDFESIIGEDMYFVAISYSQDRGTVVVSHRKYLQALIPMKLREAKETILEQKTGIVTGSAKYGVFVEFEGCLTGMIHVSDLGPELSELHKDRKLKPGTVIDFYIKEIISDRKITLVQGKPEKKVDPWNGVEDRYKTPVTVVGTIRTIKEYGVFVEVEKNLVGLLHVSEFPDDFEIDTLKRGDDITVDIIRVEAETRKIFLKL